MTNKTNCYRIALADDDVDDQLLFSLALKEISETVELTTYNNGTLLMDALLQTDRTLPQVIFLDLNMPKKNGLQCLREIRGHEGLRHIPVVILTTSMNQKEINSVYESGASLYCRKPSDFSKLVALIEKVFSMDHPTHFDQPASF